MESAAATPGHYRQEQPHKQSALSLTGRKPSDNSEQLPPIEYCDHAKCNSSGSRIKVSDMDSQFLPCLPSGPKLKSTDCIIFAQVPRAMLGDTILALGIT